jgi:enoyl-CoA hydratase/carnithine racemase
VAAAKRSLSSGLETDLDGALAVESKEFGQLCLSKDMHEGMAAFVDKRAAQFTGE